MNGLWQSKGGMRRSALLVFTLLTPLAALPGGRADEPKELKEPVYRISNARVETPVNAAPQHPLDPALQLARDGLKNIRDNVRDYTCVLVKRERINGELRDYEYMATKVRNEKRSPDGQVLTPFSVYMYFLKPDDIAGREVMYVAHRNDGKMIAHEAKGLLSKFPSVWIRPDSQLAMKDNRYPITEVGIENLIVQLIDRGERDRQRGECEVTFHKDANINGRKCTMLQVVHPHPRPYFDFHMAQIFIDDELQVPLRYAAYLWPTTPGGQPELIEEYTYLKLKLNQGLTEQDFNPKNPEYRF